MFPVGGGVFSTQVGFFTDVTAGRHWAAMVFRYEALGTKWYSAKIARMNAQTGCWSIAEPLADGEPSNSRRDALAWVRTYVTNAESWPYTETPV